MGVLFSARCTASKHKNCSTDAQIPNRRRKSEVTHKEKDDALSNSSQKLKLKSEKEEEELKFSPCMIYFPNSPAEPRDSKSKK